MNDNGGAHGLWFTIEVDGEEYIAFISSAALHVYFSAAGTSKQQLTAAYRRHRKMIDAIAMAKFQDQAPRPIQLDIGDFNGAADLARSLRAQTEKAVRAAH